MTPRRRAPKRTSSRNGADPTAVLLEDMRSQFRVVIEAVQGCASKGEVAALSGKVDALGTDVTALKAVVKNCVTKGEFATLRAEVQGGFDAMNQRFDILTAEVARKAEGAALGALERRVTALEQRVGS